MLLIGNERPHKPQEYILLLPDLFRWKIRCLSIDELTFSTTGDHWYFNI